MLILAAQINPTIGDLKNNTAKILSEIERGRQFGAQLIIFPELAICGYPPEDLLLHADFIDAVNQQLELIIDSTEEISVIVGLPRHNSNVIEKSLFNSAALIRNKKLEGYADKILLPTYDVFNERRYFEPGDQVVIWEINGFHVAVTICEDLWEHSGSLLYTHYRKDPVKELLGQSIDFAVNLSASPYSFKKFSKRVDAFSKVSSVLKCPIICCNQVGGQDDLIFDGHSFVISPKGLLKCAKGFEEDELLVNLLEDNPPIDFIEDELGGLFKALVMGVHDYFSKSGFQKGCLGLSGGIDSAVAACIAVEALGSENVLGVIMPSRFSSIESARDASLLARRLGIKTIELSIEEPFESYLSLLKPHFKELSFDITEENLQARTRGMILMALSNKWGYLVLSTGNKSEFSMGYSTLYGDMCGSLTVLGDVTKKQVYQLAHWLNRKNEIIPLNTINRPPSAELRSNQKDSDSLPDYEIVDNILESYVEYHHSAFEIAKKFGYSLDLVEDLIKRIHRNEYKRRQAPPSLRVSEKAFSIGRRFPIVQGWIK